MAALLEVYLQQFLVFVLILSRVSGLFLTAPWLAGSVVPLRIRALLAVGISLIVTPLFWGHTFGAPQQLIDLAVLMLREVALGVLLGLGVMLVFAGMQLAGQIISQISGMSMADFYDPGLETSVSVFSQLLQLVGTTAFFVIGGHRQVLAGLLAQFRWMPPGQVLLPEGVLEALVAVCSQSFSLGVRAAAPTMVALLMAVLLVGLISRTLPQLNVLAIGFSINAVAALGFLLLALGGMVWIFEQEAASALELIQSALQTAAPAAG